MDSNGSYSESKGYTYKINGTTLTMSDMSRIYEFYRRACTAETLIEDWEVDKDMAFSYAIKIREIMDKYDVSEETAIYMVMNENH